MKNIANLFKLEPSSVYLVEELDNVVLFPIHNGRFKVAQVKPGFTYEVHGDEPTSSSKEAPTSAVTPGGFGSPFGAYASLYDSATPFPNPPHAPRSKKPIRKTIILVSLSSKDKDKPTSSKASLRMDYSIVTQVVISLVPSQCNVQTVAELVTQQVGFEVVLLDSKCFPLFANEATSGIDFWKSTRNLAASKSVFEKYNGKSSDVKEAAIDLTSGPPVPKKKCEREEGSSDIILDKLNSIDNKLGFVKELQTSFQCVICRGILRQPIVASCCQRIIGCDQCVNSWLQESTRCPHCSSETSSIQKFRLRGLEDTLAFLHSTAPKEEQFVPSPPESLIDVID